MKTIAPHYKQSDYNIYSPNSCQVGNLDIFYKVRGFFIHKQKTLGPLDSCQLHVVPLQAYSLTLCRANIKG